MSGGPEVVNVPCFPRKTSNPKAAWNPSFGYHRSSKLLKVMVPGVGVEPTQARGPRDFKATGERQETKDLANSLPFFRPRSPRSAVDSEDYGHPDGHLFLWTITKGWPEPG